MGIKEFIDKVKKVQEIMDDEPDEAIRIVKSIDLKKELSKGKDKVNLKDLYEFAMLLADMVYYHDYHDEAIKAYEAILKIPIKNKDEAKCYCHIGSCYYEKGDYSKGIRNLKLALEHTSDDRMIKNIYHWLALAYKDSKKFNKSIKISQKLLNLLEQYEPNEEIMDDIANAHVELSTCYWQLNNKEKSEEHFNKAISQPNVRFHIKAWAYAMKAHRLFEDKNWKEALEHYEKAISLSDSEEDKKHWKYYANLCEEKLKS